jgi:predicted regulator of Ras-like GTPase activity (Roadblock/LC7/MglB family)
MQKESETINECLNEILRTSPALKFVILIDKDGIIISKVAKMAFFDSDEEINKISILSTAVYSTAEEQGTTTPFGELKIATCEYNNGIIFITPLTHGIVVIGAESFSSLGLVRSKIISIRKKIDNLLENYVCSDLDATDSAINEQLKILFQDSNKEFFN